MSMSWQQGMTRRGVLRGVAVGAAGLAGAALVGCSSGSSNGTKPASGGANAPASAPKGPTAASIIGKNWGSREPDATPKYGGTLSWAAGSPTLAFLDPLQTAVSLPHQTVSNGYSALMHVSRAIKDRSDPLYFPDLATSWEVADPLKMVFKLRPDAKFHNIAPVNGRLLTSEDVKYAILRASTDKASLFKGNLGAIKSVDTPDPTTVVINLKSFDPMLFADFAGHYVWMTPKELVDSGKLKEQIIGTGPFVFQRWDRDSAIQFKKNPDYFIKGVPFVDELNVLQIANQETRTAAFRSGQTQINSIPKADAKAFQSDSKFVVESSLTSNNTTLFMNFKDPRWKDERVRQALSLAIDMGVMNQILEQGNGLQRGVVSAKFTGWALSQDELKSKRFFMRFNLQEAKQLLSAAGFPNGVDSPLLYSTSNGQEHMDHVQWIAETWTKNGINKVKLVGQDWPTLRKQQDEHTYDGLCIGADGQPQPELYLLDYRTGGSKNGSGIAIPELDADINKVIGIVDLKERQEKAKELSRKLMEKVQYKITYTDGPSYEAWSKDTHNYIGAPADWYTTAAFAYTWLGNA
ncbi:MAG: ABC transporter substrate-binding protein [Dehalococcoidia bacterium]|nr:ABC transporter substrate-binding protein [Dehalococcoidia bacterium]